MKLTQAQQDAVYARNHAILVSAAAGSGKTAVLVERIISLIREGERLGSMMICTFTRAAAGEMRQRLSARLTQEAEQDPAVMGQALDELESAEVSTIHSFCQRILRDEFQAAGIDPMFTLMSEQKGKLMFAQSVKEAVNDLCDARDEDFLYLKDAAGQKNVLTWSESLYRFLMSIPEPFVWLQDQIAHVGETPLRSQQWYRLLQDHVYLQLQGIPSIIEGMRRLMEDDRAIPMRQDVIDMDMATWQANMDRIRRGDDLREVVCGYTLGKKASRPRGADEDTVQWDDLFTDARKKQKTLLDKLCALLNFDDEQLQRQTAVIRRLLTGLMHLTRRTWERFSENKRKTNDLDFNDLQQLTLQVLGHEDVRLKLQSGLRHIFVDECQDVSAIQDAIIQALHGPECCLFMVGDVKQSIYRFRLADPSLFLQRMRTWSDDADAPQRRIFLSSNFRSRPGILDATNRVFRRILQPSVTELSYEAQDELIPGRGSEGEHDPVQILLMPAGDGAAAHRQQAARIAADRINALMKEQWVDNDGVPHPYRYRDIVILMPSVSGKAEKTAQILQSRGIPVYVDSGTSFLKVRQVMVFHQLLMAVDNLRQDVPLLTALTMVPFRFSDEELAAIRIALHDGDKPYWQAFLHAAEDPDAVSQPLHDRCRRAKEQLERWHFLSQVMGVTDFLWLLLRETGLMAVASALPDGELRRANLRLLCTRAAEFQDAGGCTLHDFIMQIRDNDAAGDNRTARVLSENDDLVRIMTIHKSKGLQFKAVILLGMDDKLDRTGPSQTKGLQIHPQLGVTLPYCDGRYHICRATVLDDVLKQRTRFNERSERARVLYVAMTRAEEKLVIISGYTDKDLRNWQADPTPWVIDNAETYSDWIMNCVVNEHTVLHPYSQFSTSYPQDGNPWYVSFLPDVTEQVVENRSRQHNVLQWVRQVVSTQPDPRLVEKWDHLYDVQPTDPLKTSVTALVHGALRDDRIEQTEQDKAQPMVDAPQADSEVPAEDPLSLAEEWASWLGVPTEALIPDQSPALPDDIAAQSADPFYGVSDGKGWVRPPRKETPAPTGKTETPTGKTETPSGKIETPSGADEAQKPRMTAVKELPKVPRFMAEEQAVTGAEAGTITHRVLALLDLQAMADMVRAGDPAGQLERQLDRMASVGILTPREKTAIRRRSLLRFYQSPLGKRILQSQRVEREWHFNHVRGTGLLQGVIDCAFLQDGGWVLVDYKTDYIEDEAAFVSRYRLQLSLYGRAVADITGMPVKELWLFALRRGRAYMVEPAE